MDLVPVSSAHPYRSVAGSAVREFGPMLLVLAVLATLLVALAHVAQTSSRPSPAADTREPLASFEFEQVAVGLKRVVDDGAGHRPGERSFLFEPEHGAIALDASQALVSCCQRPGLLAGTGAESRLLRLGQARPLASWDDEGLEIDEPVDMAVAPGGTVWVAGPGLASFDGERWTVHRRARDSRVLEVGPDGTAWVGTSTRRLTVVAIRSGGSYVYTPENGLPAVAARWGGVISDIETTPDGRVWVGIGARSDGQPGGLIQFDGRRWRVVRPLGRGHDARVEGLATATDGALWAYLVEDPDEPASAQHPSHALLARFDGHGWELLGEADGVPPPGLVRRGDAPRILLETGSDGWIWLTPVGGQGCRRLVSYRDGVATEHLPSGYCVGDLEIAADGRAWVMAARRGSQAGNERGTGLYVVDPRP